MAMASIINRTSSLRLLDPHPKLLSPALPMFTKSPSFPKTLNPRKTLVSAAMSTLIDHTSSFDILSDPAPKTHRECNRVLSPVTDHLAKAALFSAATSSHDHPAADAVRSLLPNFPDAAASSLAADLLTGSQALGGPRITYGASVWIDHSLLNASFTGETEVNLVRFRDDGKAREVVDKANYWFENATGCRLNNPMFPLPFYEMVGSETRLLTCNAMKFEGSWADRFYPLEAEDRDSIFYKLNGAVPVPFMTTDARQCIGCYDGFKVLRLPYKRGRDRRMFSMYVFLPDADDGLWQLEEKLGSDEGFLDRHVPCHAVDVGEFRVPFGTSGMMFVTGMGYVWPPTRNKGCDLPCDGYATSWLGLGLDKAKKSRACHGGSQSVDAVDFVADHPFICVIREDVSGVVLAVGHVLAPQAP